MNHRLQKFAFIGVLALGLSACDRAGEKIEDAGGDEGNKQSAAGSPSASDKPKANAERKMDWSYEVISQSAGPDFPAAEGKGIAVIPASGDAPAQLVLSNPTTLAFVHFYVDSDLSPGAYPVMSASFQIDSMRCAKNKPETDVNMEMVIEQQNPVKGSFAGKIRCRGEENYLVTVSGSFDDS